MYSLISADINGVFDSAPWIAENIKTYPDNFTVANQAGSFIKFMLLPANSGMGGYANKQTSGMLFIQIYCAIGVGDKELVRISDRLDAYFQGKQLANGTQLGTSQYKNVGPSPDGKLYRADYAIIYNYYGEI